MSVSYKALSLLTPMLPAAAKAAITPYYAPAMVRGIQDLIDANFATTEINDKTLPQITLPDGVILVGQMPTPKEVKLFSPFFNKIGIPSNYICMALDYVTRYKYPHMAVGFEHLTENLNQRRLFHPQHRNFAQECDTFSDDLKNKIKEVFTINHDWTIVDIGAYMGYGSLWASNIVTNGRIISVEAIRDNYDIANKILSLNNKKNWSLINSAIWHTSNQTLEIARTTRQANAIDSNVIDGGSSKTVKTISIPSLIEMSDSKVDLLSLTVNGAEVEAIRGMEDTDKSALPRRVLTPGWYKENGTLRAKIIEPMLADLGYTMARTPGNFIYAWQE